MIADKPGKGQAWTRRRLLAALRRLVLLACTIRLSNGGEAMAMSDTARDAVALPAAQHDGDVALEAALAMRRSTRTLAARPLSLVDVAQLMWAGQGLNRAGGGRTAPSAGALYPLELHLVAGAVTDLPPGLYRYRPARHDLAPDATGDLRVELARVARQQSWIADAAAVLVVAAVERRTAGKYGDRARRYVLLEAGHAAQNIALQAAALGLGCTPVGAFDDDRLHALLDLPREERPLCLLPVGHPG
jgi:SagB-type dehydrogenase family enzyme